VSFSRRIKAKLVQSVKLRRWSGRVSSNT
jgi:hypothetical protein